MLMSLPAWGAWIVIAVSVVLILLAAVIVSALLGKWQEAVAILAVVVLFALLGFFQEYRAERAIEALRQMAAPTATVLRDGEEQDIAARDLVPGDVVLLQAGNRVPADARLIEAINYVRQDFKCILVITHLEELKDAFPSRIEVEKTPGGSRVRVVSA